MARVLQWLNVPLNIRNEEFSAKPDGIRISASPNPFNSKCAISITLPDRGNVMIYDTSGKLVIPAASNLDAGKHIIILTADDLPSGLYFAVANSENESASTKLLLIR